MFCIYNILNKTGGEIHLHIISLDIRFVIEYISSILPVGARAPWFVVVDILKIS
jgi:hypothetical protein